MSSRSIRSPSFAQKCIVIGMIALWLSSAPVRADLGDQLFKLTPSAAAVGEADRFGMAVAVSGNVALIGARVDDSPINDAGSAFLYNVTTGNELAMLTASDAVQFDNFGWSVAIDGSTALVGAIGSSGAPGAAYLFDVSDPQNPVERRKLTAPDAALFDAFGVSVAIKGNTALVGNNSDDDGGTNSGSAWLFDLSDPNDPVALPKLIASDDTAGDRFGSSVAIGDNLALVGSPLDDDLGSNSGSVYLFDIATSDEFTKLTASDGAADDNFGASMAISGNIAVVGSPLDDDGAGNAGAAYLFDVSDPNNPVELRKLVAPSPTVNDRFGSSVAIYGNVVAIGVPDDDDGGNTAGGAFLFNATTGTQLAKLTAADAAPGDGLGTAVGLSEFAAVAGAPIDIITGGFPSGSAYVFGTVPETSTLSLLLLAIIPFFSRGRLTRTQSATH